VLKDLIKARLDAGGQILFEAKVSAVRDVEGERPAVRFATKDGEEKELLCDFIAGCDGSYGVCRPAIPDGVRKDYLRIYPFGWFGILAKAPPSSDELVYARHDRGFALISTRSPDVQRMYFQCDPDDKVENWSDDRIWAELQARTEGGGFRLKEGAIFQKNIVPMRSFVCEPMQHGRLFLAGDAAHAVPPTGAKGLNLAASDVWHLDRALGAFFADGSTALMEGYTQAALRRVWRAQHFSWWMTSMLHRFPEASEFDDRRQLAELEFVTGSASAATALAQTYVGTPFG
jgi:p-hydroxybenzoate 3-monooxygenase